MRMENDGKPNVSGIVIDKTMERVRVAVARRPPIARRLFFARVLESTGGRVESDSCDARHSKTAGDAAATCSRDLFAARDADDAAVSRDALLPGEREGKKDPFSPAS